MFLLHDFCNRIIQASKFMLKSVIIRKNNIVINCLFIIFRLGFILKFAILSIKHVIVFLKYHQSESVLRGFFCISKNSLKQFIRHKSILKIMRKNFYSLNGFLILSTNKGLLLDIECYFYKIGGKALLAIY